MQITKTDKSNADNLIRILKRAKLELEGAEEILATAEVLKWMGGVAARIDKDLKDQEEAVRTMEALASAHLVQEAPPPESAKKAKKEKVKKAE